jgi:GTPase Era involved in 16S rRNA processing
MNYIDIAIIGPVSAGKSTLLNTIFVDNFSEMKIKRNTMQPQIYVGGSDSFDPNQILEINTESNLKHYNEKNIAIQPIIHNVGLLKDFIGNEGVLAYAVHFNKIY